MIWTHTSPGSRLLKVFADEERVDEEFSIVAADDDKNTLTLHLSDGEPARRSKRRPGGPTWNLDPVVFGRPEIATTTVSYDAVRVELTEVFSCPECDGRLSEPFNCPEHGDVTRLLTAIEMARLDYERRERLQRLARRGSRRASEILATEASA